MPSHRATRTVKHPPGRMFELVADVESYPEFLPLCEDLKVLRRTKDDAGRDVLIAAMTVGYRAIRETFTSRVTLDRENCRILVEYIDGPFKHLSNRWGFTPAPGGASVEFDIEYEFRSRMLGLLMGTMFDQAFRRFSAAFEERANRLYGSAAA